MLLPKYLALDSSQLGSLCDDLNSPSTHQRVRARAFLNRIIDKGWIIFLSIHHIEEIFRHGNEEKARCRADAISNFSNLSWVRPFASHPGIGSVVDILAREMCAALNNPSWSAIDIRDGVRPEIISFGEGTLAIAPYLQDWSQLREIFLDKERRSQEIVSIMQSNLWDLGETKIAAWLGGTRRPAGSANDVLSIMQSSLAKDIVKNGDKRIRDPRATSENFIQRVNDEMQIMYSSTPNSGMALLASMGIIAGDIDPDTTMSEIGDLAHFRQALKVANQLLNKDWQRICEKLHPNTLPSWIIQAGLRSVGQLEKERKGGDINDGYLASLAAYVDHSFVDKRTMEKLRRLKEKSRNIPAIIQSTMKSCHYSEALTVL